MIYLRKAEWSDMDLLYEWANDFVVRKNSFQSEKISYNVHQSWFTRMMYNEKMIQYILMEDEKAVGQIRMTIDGCKAEIGYSISANYRQKGYGRKILQLVAEEVRNKFPDIKELVAKVKPENTVSKRVFESEGYEMKYLCYFLKMSGGGIEV